MKVPVDDPRQDFRASAPRNRGRSPGACRRSTGASTRHRSSPPGRATSSSRIDASVMPKPWPPYSSGNGHPQPAAVGDRVVELGGELVVVVLAPSSTGRRTAARSATADRIVLGHRSARSPPATSWRGRRVAVEEADDRVVEEVVAVAGDHVAGPGDVDELGVRHAGAGSPARPPRSAGRSQRPRTSSVGTRERVDGTAEPVRSTTDERVSSPTRTCPHEPRVPVPHPPTVLALAHVLRQPRQVGRARAVRVVGGDRVGHLVERGEAVEVPVMKAPMRSRPAPPSGGRRRRAPGPGRPPPAPGPRPPRAATRSRRGTRRRGPAGGASTAAIASTSSAKASERVVAVGRPVAVAVAAEVDGPGRQPARRAAARCPAQEWRVCPPPWSSTTVGPSTGPATSAASRSPSAPSSSVSVDVMEVEGTLLAGCADHERPADDH